MFSSGKCTWSKMNISLTLNTIHFMDIETVPIIKKSWFFYLYFSLPSYSLFTSSYTLTGYTPTCLYGPGDRVVISQIATSSKDKKASFGRMSKSPCLLLKKKKKKSLKMLVLIQCLWLRHDNVERVNMEKDRIKDKLFSANTVVELWC